VLKKTVIEAIYQLLLNYFGEIPGEKNNSVKILICASSGKAIFLIGGVTLHYSCITDNTIRRTNARTVSRRGIYYSRKLI